MTERELGGAQEGGVSERDSKLTQVSSRSVAESKAPSRSEHLPVKQAAPIYNLYPPPLAKYEEIVEDPLLFKETLEKLHLRLNTKFMVPTIGGKELDLHRLFVEVTSRGGLQKVIRDRKWKEITAVFSFPSTATNASFVLRKYYLSLIHHYEQIYFFGAEGYTSPPTAARPVPPSVSAQGVAEPVQPSSEANAQKRKRNTTELAHGAAPSKTNYPVVGVIDGKFDHGYLVTVSVGSEKLRGVLYHTPEYPSGQAPTHPAVPSICGNDATVSGVRRRRRRKKTELRKRDPSHPRPNRSGYNFFFAEQHARLKLLHPGKDREISRMIGEIWNKLKESEKAVYQEKGVKDKERYRNEMEEYTERLKTTSPVISHVLPLQQRLAVPEVDMVETDSKTETEEADSKMETEEADSKMETEEVDFGVAQSAIVLRNGEDSDRTDTEVHETPEKSLEPETPEAKVSGTESAIIVTETATMITEPPTEENGFELKRRVDGCEEEAPDSNCGDAVESAKEELSGEGL